IRSNQFDFTVETTRHPVVIDLISLRAALDVIASVLIVEITVLHAKNRSRMCKLISCHVNRMLPRSIAAVIDLDVFHQQRTRVCVRTQDSVGRTIMDHAISQSDVMRVMIDATKTSTGNIKPFEDVMVGESKLDCIGSTGDHRSESIHPKASNG